MIKTLSITMAAAAFLAVGTMGSMAAQRSSTIMTTKPPHASTTGLSHRALIANTRGANRRGFCPPGQAAKPGTGSAFKC